jgi:rod shape-determining protein MreB
MYCRASILEDIFWRFYWQMVGKLIESGKSSMKKILPFKQLRYFSKFNNLFGLFSHDVGIDLGTANTLVFVKGKGIVIREPSVVARHKKTKVVLAIGTEAKKMLGKTPASIVTVRPLRGGVIADFDATEAMISHYIKQVHEMGGLMHRLLARPKVVIGIPSSVTEVQRRAVWEAALTAGAREAYLIEEPMAAAMGENISVFASKGVMVVDIGGGTTEIAVISLGGIVVGRSLRMAGDDMDQAIVHYVRLRHGLVIGEQTGEDIKIKIGSAYDKKAKGKRQKAKVQEEDLEEKESVESRIQSLEFKEEDSVDVARSDKERMAIVRGRDIETGLPRSLRVAESGIREALSPILTQIIAAIAEVLEETPPELLPDILESGILLTGGGANLAGLDQLIVDKVHMPVVVSGDPLTSVVRGTGKVLEDEELLERVKVIGGLK